jgi:hypothetical protein
VPSTSREIHTNADRDSHENLIYLYFHHWIAINFVTPFLKIEFSNIRVSAVISPRALNNPATVVTEDSYFTEMCTLFKNPRHFHIKYSIFC